MDKIAEYYYHKGVYEGLSRGRADALKILEESMKRKADPVIVIKQQEVDLEKEMDSYFKKWWMDLTDQGYILRTPDGTANLISVKNIARHFFELGKNSK